MARQHEYTAQRGYEGTAIQGKVITWTVGTTPEELVARGEFRDLEQVAYAASKQLDVKRGHAVQAAAKAAAEAGEEFTVEMAQKIAQETTMVSSTRTRTGSGAAAKIGAAAKKALAATPLAERSDEWLATALELTGDPTGEIAAEIARRAEGSSKRKSR